MTTTPVSSDEGWQISTKQGLFSWDLATFRYPRRPEFTQVKTVERMKYLDLEFSDVAGMKKPPSFSSSTRRRSFYRLTVIAAKNEFIKELAALENVRNVDHNLYESYLRDRKKRAMS